MSTRRASTRRHKEQLSPREAEVCQLIKSGLSNKEIAAQLSISVNTVKSHVHNLLKSLSVESRAKMVAASRNGDYARFLLDHYRLWGKDGAFTFPDGETWHRDEAAVMRRV